jgi:hypothetical protein
VQVNKPALLGLFLAVGFSAVLDAQTGGTQSEGQNVILVNDAVGLVSASPDGTKATVAYVVPQGQELCLTDIHWRASGAANAEATVGIFNRAAGAESGGYWLWQVDPTLNSGGFASGLDSFRAGPRITATGGINWSSETLTALTLTIYGIQRPVATGVSATPTPCFP